MSLPSTGADELVDGLDHVYGNTDRPRLIGNRPGDGLANPPGGVGAELVAALVLELVHRLHQADVALLNQVQELEPPVRVFLGDAHDEAQVRLGELFLRPAVLAAAAADHFQGILEILARGARRFFLSSGFCGARF